MKRTRHGYNVGMEIVLALGLGIGLASVAGVRAFLPLMAALSIVIGAGFGNPPVSFMQINNWLSIPVIVALILLLVLESVLDKFAATERLLNWVLVPVRAVSGAAVFAIMVVDRDPSALLGPMSTFRYAGLSALAPYLVAGAVIAGVVAVLKVILRPLARDASSGVSTSFLSFIEDAVGLVGGVLALFVPFLPVLLVAFLLFFYARIRKRRGRKFGGLRILGD